VDSVTGACCSGWATGVTPIIAWLVTAVGYRREVNVAVPSNSIHTTDRFLLDVVLNC
jgi:hypothetical protein